MDAIWSPGRSLTEFGLRWTPAFHYKDSTWTPAVEPTAIGKRLAFAHARGRHRFPKFSVARGKSQRLYMRGCPASRSQQLSIFPGTHPLLLAKLR